MKNNYVFQAAYASELAKESAVGRVQVYRESRGGNSIPCFGTDSDTEAAWPEISLPVLFCVNLFQDCFFALIACDLSGQKEISGVVEMCL